MMSPSDHLPSIAVNGFTNDVSPRVSAKYITRLLSALREEDMRDGNATVNLKPSTKRVIDVNSFAICPPTPVKLTSEEHRADDFKVLKYPVSLGSKELAAVQKGSFISRDQSRLIKSEGLAGLPGEVSQPYKPTAIVTAAPSITSSPHISRKMMKMNNLNNKPNAVTKRSIQVRQSLERKNDPRRPRAESMDWEARESKSNQKDEHYIRHTQRQVIYLLNSLMTQIENHHFTQFKQANSLRPKTYPEPYS